MDFSYSKLVGLKPQKEKKLMTFLLAIITAATFFVPYMILGDGYFTFFGDFNVQQIPFYKLCHEAVKSGNIKWSFNTDLGANFIGSYSFYLLGSPFFWLTIPFPNDFVPYLMGPLLILKFGCAALTAYLYIRRFTKTPQAASIGGLLYAFSGFSVYNIFFNHFHEAIIAFPLLLLALELFITENKRGVFALAVCFCAIVNYFFFFGMVVFCIIYFFVRLYCGAIKIKFKRFLALFTEAVIGVGMSAILLVPSCLAIMGNERISSILLGWNAIMYGKEQIYLNIIECFFFPPDLPARPVFFPGADVKWSSLGGWMPVLGMTGVFAFFATKKKHWIKRIITICIVMALVPILNSAFYAFNCAYYARWFYMPILIMALATAMLFEDESAQWETGLKRSGIITVLFMLVIGFFPSKNESGKIIFGLHSQDDELTYTTRFWVEVGIAIACLGITYILLKLKKESRKSFFKVAIISICVVSSVYSNFFIATGRFHSYEIKGVMIDSLVEGDVTLEGDGEFRIDTYDCVDNTGMYLGYPSINAFHSIVPSSIMEFYEYLGVERSVGSRPDTDIPAIRPLLSVKYLLNRIFSNPFIDENGETKMSGYKYIKTQDGYYVYENENYIPYGFSYDYYMTKDFCDSYDDEAKARMMLKAVLLDSEQIEKYGDILKNIEDARENTDGITLYTDDEAMSQDSKRLAQTSASSFKYDNNGFTAKVSRDKDSLVFFSVPYDKGWSATVNGNKAEIEKVNVGFMAVKVNEGESTIRFDYTTPGLYLGIKISAGAVILFLIYLIISKIVISKRPSENAYPEGEELLKAWKDDDLKLAINEYSKRLENINEEYEYMPEIEIPHINNGFEGGFKIDTSTFDKPNDE